MSGRFSITASRKWFARAASCCPVVRAPGHTAVPADQGDGQRHRKVQPQRECTGSTAGNAVVVRGQEQHSQRGPGQHDRQQSRSKAAVQRGYGDGAEEKGKEAPASQGCSARVTSSATRFSATETPYRAAQCARQPSIQRPEAGRSLTRPVQIATTAPATSRRARQLRRRAVLGDDRDQPSLRVTRRGATTRTP